MAKSSKIRVMISSRCLDHFPINDGRSLSEIRSELKKEIESLEIFGKKTFDVWINEETPPQGGTWDSWDVCIQAVKDCDILIVLNNGNAGWAKSGGIGICHAELMTGLSQAPGKVRIIALKNVEIDESTPEGMQNKKFRDYVAVQNIFRGGTVNTEDDLKERVKEAIYDALINLTQAGVREASKGRFHSGEALDWSHMDFKTRREAIQSVIFNSMGQHSGSFIEDEHLIINLAETEILTVPDAIPASLTIGAAKEMVGQPFLRDHEIPLNFIEDRGGPLHIIGCHKTATEAQATKMLGFADATIVNAPFGIFVADNIQKVQFAFIVNCRDETTTSHGVQRFFEWMSQTGEDKKVAERSLSRARIVSAIAKETNL